MLGTHGELEDYVVINADGTENASHEPWILLGRRDKKVAAFVEETGANDAGTDSQPHAVESRHETAAAPPPAERLRADVAALAALCGRPRAPPRNRVVSPPGSAKKKRRQRKLKPFAGRPRNASRMRQLYP